jgi:Tetratricopeptide repeat
LGKYEEAVVMKREVVEKRKRILGDEHPKTISAEANLAITLGELGKREEAVVMKREVVEKRKPILGDGHPDTIRAMHNLSITVRARKNPRVFRS